MKKVFIIEDDRSLSLLYKHMLVKNGFEVLGRVRDGQHAVSMYKEFTPKPHVILMDYHLPRKNGIDISKEIFKLDSKVKIIFITADETVKKKALDMGIFSFIEKPFSLKELLNTIKKAIRDYEKDNLPSITE
ncbi:MAG: Signal transduction response regulator [Promethearchaeota archaeon]|nr:MAG: Signal transduction response regulator [Candidatus Lokiarchaeota archaeon]